MTTYNGAAVADSVIAFQAGITLQQGRALRDNPIAISEGATGAPINRSGWHPYNALLIGDANTGLFYDFAVSGAVADVVTPNFEDKYEYMILYDAVIPQFGPRDWHVGHYQEVSASYLTDVVLASAVSLLGTSGRIEILSPRRAINPFGNEKILRSRFRFSSNNINGGKLYMYRRLFITNI